VSGWDDLLPNDRFKLDGVTRMRDAAGKKGYLSAQKH
jgi:hypothetical protein